MERIKQIDTYINDEQWQFLINAFQSRLMDDYPISDCITMLIDDYIDITETTEEQSHKDEVVKEESREVFFERKVKPVWDYIYSLQRQINSLKQVQETYGPKLSTLTYPLNVPPMVPPNGVYDLDWYKARSDSNGNVPLGGEHSTMQNVPTGSQYITGLTTVTLNGMGSDTFNVGEGTTKLKKDL